MFVSVSAQSIISRSFAVVREKNEVLYGARPYDTSSRTVSPSGAVGFCGRMAIDFASARGSASWTSAPSRSTRPPRRGWMRQMVLSRVDLPQPFAPMSAVIFPSGIVRLRSSMMTTLS